MEEAEAQAMEEAEALLEARQSDGGRLQDWWALDEGDSVGAQVHAAARHAVESGEALERGARKRGGFCRWGDTD